MPDSLTRLLKAVLPRATAVELAEAAERLGSFVESRAAWMGDTAEGAVRRVEGVVLGRGSAATGAGQPTAELEDAVWAQVMGAIAPQLQAIVARARAVRESADAPAAAVELARDVVWLVGELQAAWAREVAIRVRRPSGEWRAQPDPSA
jgi:hypothetical protein